MDYSIPLFSFLSGNVLHSAVYMSHSYLNRKFSNIAAVGVSLLSVPLNQYMYVYRYIDILLALLEGIQGRSTAFDYDCTRLISTTTTTAPFRCANIEKSCNATDFPGGFCHRLRDHSHRPVQRQPVCPCARKLPVSNHDPAHSGQRCQGLRSGLRERVRKPV